MKTNAKYLFKYVFKDNEYPKKAQLILQVFDRFDNKVEERKAEYDTAGQCNHLMIDIKNQLRLVNPGEDSYYVYNPYWMISANVKVPTR